MGICQVVKIIFTFARKDKIIKCFEELRINITYELLMVKYTTRG